MWVRLPPSPPIISITYGQPLSQFRPAMDRAKWKVEENVRAFRFSDRAFDRSVYAMQPTGGALRNNGQLAFDS